MLSNGYIGHTKCINNAIVCVQADSCRMLYIYKQVFILFHYSDTFLLYELSYEGPAKSSVTNRLPKFYPRYILKCVTALEWGVK